MALEPPRAVTYRLTGPLGDRVRANVDHWLLTAPIANPGMIEMFAMRDREPKPDLVPWAGEFAGKYLISGVQALRMSDSLELRHTLTEVVARLVARPAVAGEYRYRRSRVISKRVPIVSRLRSDPRDPRWTVWQKETIGPAERPLRLLLLERAASRDSGWLQRLTLAGALLPDPELLLLDEPLGGLDPGARLAIKRLLRELQAEGKTIWLNSHLLPDVEALADRVALLHRGRLVASGPLGELLAATAAEVEITFGGNAAPIRPIPGVQLLARGAGRTTWSVPGDEPEILRAALQALLQGGAVIEQVGRRRERLERLFERLIRTPRRAA